MRNCTRNIIFRFRFGKTGANREKKLGVDYLFVKRQGQRKGRWRDNQHKEREKQ